MRVLITLASIVGLLSIAVLSLLNIGRELLRPPLLSVRSDSKSMVDGNSPEGDANGAPHCPGHGLSREILGKMWVPADHGRCRSQSASGGAADIRTSHRGR
jgi:hypothetical protein